MSDLATNENKYDLFKGVLLVNNNDVTQYGLIYMSEIEITAKSSINYEDAENELKNIASYLGFNCVLNIVRDKYTDSMQTSGTMDTEGRISSFSNSYKSSSTIEMETKVNNNFRIKGALAIIGKPNPNGVSVDINAILERVNMICECLQIIKPIYQANCMIDDICNKEKKLPYITTIALSIIPLIGMIPAFYNVVILALFYFNNKKIINETNNVYRIYEPKLKFLVSKYGNEITTIYKMSSRINIKHIGE